MDQLAVEQYMGEHFEKFMLIEGEVKVTAEGDVKVTAEGELNIPMKWSVMGVCRGVIKMVVDFVKDVCTGCVQKQSTR